MAVIASTKLKMLVEKPLWREAKEKLALGACRLSGGKMGEWTNIVCKRVVRIENCILVDAYASRLKEAQMMAQANGRDKKIVVILLGCGCVWWCKGSRA